MWTMIFVVMSAVGISSIQVGKFNNLHDCAEAAASVALPKYWNMGKVGSEPYVGIYCVPVNIENRK